MMFRRWRENRAAARRAWLCRLARPAHVPSCGTPPIDKARRAH